MFILRDYLYSLYIYLKFSPNVAEDFLYCSLGEVLVQMPSEVAMTQKMKTLH